MNRMKNAIRAGEKCKKQKDSARTASVLTVSEKRHILINLYMCDIDIADNYTMENHKLRDFCKSLAMGAWKISDITWEKVAAEMKVEQPRHLEGGEFWHNDPWLSTEYTVELLKEMWSQLTSDDIESLHSFGGFDTSAYKDTWINSPHSSTEPHVVPEQYTSTAVPDFWNDEFSDLESFDGELSNDTMPTALSPRPSKKGKSLNTRKIFTPECCGKLITAKGLAELMDIGGPERCLDAEDSEKKCAWPSGVE
ncbi:hypothetical protein ACMFMG_003165 [Clarireedia jacksonii]